MNLRRISADSIVGVLAAIALVVAVQTSAPVEVRVPLGVAVAVVMPGLLGFRALHGRRPDTVIAAVICLVASVGVLALLGVVLNLLPPGLTSTSWSVALLGIAVVLGAVGDYRRHANSRADVAVTRRATGRRWTPGRRWLAVALTTLACAGLLGAGAALTLSSKHAELGRQHLTEMWLSQDNGHPVVHVRNEEGFDADYRIVISVAGNGQKEETMRISDGAEWSTTITTPPDLESPSPTLLPLSVSLYRADEKVAYRQVRITRAPG